jgi:precorrin-6B methylase 2
VFAPTPTSREVAEALRVQPGETVIDVGCGSGVLSFVAARLGAVQVHGVDVDAGATTCASENARRLGLQDVTHFHAGDLFAPLGAARADVIIGDVSGIPDDLAEISGWFPGGHAGGPTGAETPMTMLEEAPRHLTASGRLYLPTGTIQDEGAILAAAKRLFGAGSLQKVRERLIPLPGKLAESRVVQRLERSGIVRLVRRGTRALWRLRVWECAVSDVVVVPDEEPAPRSRAR